MGEVRGRKGRPARVRAVAVCCVCCVFVVSAVLAVFAVTVVLVTPANVLKENVWMLNRNTQTSTAQSRIFAPQAGGQHYILFPREY